MSRFVAPRTGAPELTLAEGQEEYQPITVAIYSNSNYPTATEMLARVTFTKAERKLIVQGEDVYISELIFGERKFTPLIVQVGPQHYKLQGRV